MEYLFAADGMTILWENNSPAYNVPDIKEERVNYSLMVIMGTEGANEEVSVSM